MWVEITDPSHNMNYTIENEFLKGKLIEQWVPTLGPQMFLDYNSQKT